MLNRGLRNDRLVPSATAASVETVCLIVRKRGTSPISKAHVSAVIGPTPGTVLSLRCC
jgi:hypothetical protein